MKRFLTFFALAALLTGCVARTADTRVETLQSTYDGMNGCTARVEAAIVRAEETARYVLDVERTGEETRVTVREPEALAGISATVGGDDSLAITFDGMVLDAGSVEPEVCAVNAASIFLRAAAKGYVTERSRERFEDVDDALRLCFETERAGKKLLVTAYFDESDKPLYAELEEDGRILAYLQFTDFTFCDIISSH